MKSHPQKRHSQPSKNQSNQPVYKPRPEPDLQLPDEMDPAMRDMLLQLPADKRKEILSFVSIAITKSSPLPDPATFKSYNDIDPSITKVIMEDFEKTREHRRTLEALSVAEHVKYKRRGQYCGVLIVLGFLAAGALVAIFSNVVAGSIIAGAGLYIALARSFLRANLFGKGEDETEAKTPPKKKTVKS